MQLHELRALIIDSSAKSWSVIDDGPLFRADVDGRGHSHHAVLNDALEVALEWGLRADDDDDAETDDYDWGSIANFKNPTIAEVWVDVRLNGELVQRLILLRVDGGRAYLPVPEKFEGRWITRTWDRSVAGLVSGLQGIWGAHGDWSSYYLQQLRADHGTY
ncbi:hypothetical protein [Curtobacterium sp. MCLR17_054]|uniref:hypothetical protein n=1 Tax=Curtobacterium sp. MCLR17_054 TaxID=2175632 RepID=UPI000DA9BF48|nr:hypothetical protein [Curtobacterium sp. MCLR17_054]WIE69209.1 hypothetical protein DEJ08_004325 [Curtobacterium sp. MCLR17_054]